MDSNIDNIIDNLNKYPQHKKFLQDALINLYCSKHTRKESHNIPYTSNSISFSPSKSNNNVGSLDGYFHENTPSFYSK